MADWLRLLHLSQDHGTLQPTTRTKMSDAYDLLEEALEVPVVSAVATVSLPPSISLIAFARMVHRLRVEGLLQ